MGAIDRDTLRAWSRADRWLLACPIVLALAAAGAAIAERPEPTIASPQRADAARRSVELELLAAELARLQGEIDRLDIRGTEVYYDRRPLIPSDLESLTAIASRLEAQQLRLRSIDWRTD